MNVGVYFNEKIKPKVIDELSKANKEIVAAIAWFNDKEIYNVLVSKVKEGVSVDLIINNDSSNFNLPDSLDFNFLVSLGGKVNRLVLDEKLMHNKFCVIDNHTIITGSYNWTYGGSSKNLENVVLIENDIKNCEKYKAEYNRMLKVYFKHIEEAVGILRKMKLVITDLQDDITLHRYLPDNILENLRKYSSGNFLVESLNYGTSNDELSSEIVNVDEEKDLWKELPSNIKKMLNDKFINIGKVEDKPADDAIEYLLGITEIELSGYNTNKWIRAGTFKTTINFTSCDGLKKLPKLKKLDISNNLLTDRAIKTIGELTQLEKLNISSNKITTIVISDLMQDLIELDISNNNFNSIDFLDNLPNLKKIYCHGNKLSSIQGIEKGKNIEFLSLNKDTFELPYVNSMLIELGFAEIDDNASRTVKLEKIKNISNNKYNVHS